METLKRTKGGSEMNTPETENQRTAYETPTNPHISQKSALHTRFFKGWIALLLATLLIALTGCSGNAYEKLLKAEARTATASTGIVTTRVTLENQSDTTGLTPEQLKMANTMKNITYQGTRHFDDNAGIFISDNFLSLGGIGFDFTLYGLSEKKYAKLSVMKKYMDVDALLSSQSATQEATFALSDETMMELGAIWANLANRDNVVRTGNALLKTTEGDIKTVRYTIEADPELVQKALIESMRLVIEEFASRSANPEIMLASGQFETLKIDSVTLISEVDSNGYVVRDDVQIAFHTPDTRTAVHVENTRTALNQTVKIDMPLIEPSSVYSQDELDQEMPGALNELLGTFGIQTKK
jgi:hypothetical protein